MCKSGKSQHVAGMAVISRSGTETRKWHERKEKRVTIVATIRRDVSEYSEWQGLCEWMPGKADMTNSSKSSTEQHGKGGSADWGGPAAVIDTMRIRSTSHGDAQKL